MARYFAALALLGAVLADGGSHHAASAPAASYGAPTGGYEQPSYEAPAASYAPASYEQPSYDAPATGYAEPSATGYDASYADQTYAVQDTVDGFDLSKLLELLPLFIAVFAAIRRRRLLSAPCLADARPGYPPPPRPSLSSYGCTADSWTSSRTGNSSRCPPSAASLFKATFITPA